MTHNDHIWEPVCQHMNLSMNIIYNKAWFQNRLFLQCATYNYVHSKRKISKLKTRFLTTILICQNYSLNKNTESTLSILLQCTVSVCNLFLVEMGDHVYILKH